MHLCLKLDSPVIILSILFLTGFSGLIFFLFDEKTLNKIKVPGLLFALGTLAGTVTFLLLPEHFSTPTDISKFLVWAVPAFFVWYLPSLNINRNENTTPSFAALLLGDAIHNATTSLLLVSVSMTRPGSGWMLLPAILLHEIPHKAGNFGILHFSGLNRIKSLLLVLMSCSLFYSGMLFTDLHINREYREYVVPVVVGSLSYTFVSGLAHEYRTATVGKMLLWVTAGMLFMFLIHFSSGHNY
jgi:zinc transporter ZupT